MAIDDDAVGGDLFSGANNELHADFEVVECNFTAVDEASSAGTEVGKRPNRISRATLRSELKPLAQQDERHDDGAGLEVDKAVFEAAEQHHGRPQQRRQRPHRDQRVHRGRTLAQVHPCGSMEAPARPHDDRRRQGCHQPLPAIESQRRDHREHHCWNRQHNADDQPLFEVSFSTLFGLGGLVRRFDDRVPERFDLLGERELVDRPVVEHGCPAVGEVDACIGYGIELAKSTFDLACTGSARHSVDLQIGAQRHVDAHGLKVYGGLGPRNGRRRGWW